MKWTQTQVDLVTARYATEGPSKLAQELGMTCWAIVAKARRLGLASTRKRPPAKFEWTQEMEAMLRARYVSEGSPRLAEELGLSHGTVMRRASMLGLHTNAGHVRHGKEVAENSRTCNIRYFDTWSPNMAYILGFLFADGSVGKQHKDISVYLAAKDECVLEFIRSEVCPGRKIYLVPESTSQATGRVRREQRAIKIHSTVLVKSLTARGLRPRKTYNQDPFPEVPDDMLPHFIRGYFDGNGSTSAKYTNVSFAGSVNILTGIRDRLAKIGMRPKRVHIRQSGSATWGQVAWSSYRDITLFRDYVYKDCTFCLDRKKRLLDQRIALSPR